MDGWMDGWVRGCGAPIAAAAASAAVEAHDLRFTPAEATGMEAETSNQNAVG